MIGISQQLPSLLRHLWNSNGLHLLKRTTKKQLYLSIHKFNHIFKSMIKLHTPLNHASIKRIPTAILCLRPSRVTPPYKMKLRSLRINQSVTLCNIIVFIVMTLTEGINNKSLLVTLTSDLNLENWFSEEVSLFHNCKKEKLFEFNGSFNSFFLPLTHDNTK